MRDGGGATRRRVAVVGATALALCVLAGCASPSSDPGDAGDTGAPVADVKVSDSDGLHAVVLPEPYDAPRAALTATDGSSYSLAEDADDPLTLVFFGYTSCPDICQVVMADIASALTRLDEAERAQVGMQFVTTDPARDDEATLRAYLDRFDPEFGGLTGPLPRIVETGKALGVTIAKGERLPSGGYEVLHDTPVIGVLPDGTAPLVWTPPVSAEQIAEDIRTVLADGVPTGGTP